MSGQGDTLYQSTFPIYIHQAYDPDNAAVVPSNEQPYVQQLEQSINSGTPVVLALGPSDFHAIVAWEYKLSNGDLVIGVSDPNFGNVPRYAYYTGGHFSYAGSGFTYTTFIVISPGILQWAWFSPFQLGGTVTSTNPYYTFVFSDSPITIASGTDYANFTTQADSLTFTSSINGVVGFEEGNIQAYAIPQGIQYNVLDPGVTSSHLEIIIPQNATSIVGYQLTSTSSAPLSILITPTISRLNVTASTAINLSLAIFSDGVQTHSVLNATSVPVASSQTAVLSVPDWSNLNSSTSAASVQVFTPGSSQAITSYTLTNEQSGTAAPAGFSSFLFPVVVIAAVVIAAVALLAYVRLRKAPKTRFELP